MDQRTQLEMQLLEIEQYLRMIGECRSLPVADPVKLEERLLVEHELIGIALKKLVAEQAAEEF